MTSAIQQLAAECAPFLPPVRRDEPKPKRLKYGMASGTPEYHALANTARRAKLVAEGLTTHGTERIAVPKYRTSKYSLDRKAIGHAAYVAAIRRMQKENKLTNRPRKRK